MRASALALAAIAVAAVAQGQDPLATAGEALMRGDARSATEILERHIGEHADDADGHRMLGIALSLAGRRSPAINSLEAAVGLAPQNPVNHLALGQALSQFGLSDRAEQAYRTALELDSELGPAHEGLALSLAMRGSQDAAAQHFTRALSQSTEPARRAKLHFYRGRTHAEAGRQPAAVEDFRAALRLNPALGPAHLELGRILTQGASPEEAIAALRRASELQPNSFDAHHLWGEQLLRNGEAALAVVALRRAAELRPEDQAAAYALGRALRAAGRSEEARHHLAGIARSGSRRAVEEASITEAGRLNDAGLAAEQEDDLEMALEKYEAAARIAPDHVLFHRNAALVLGRLGRWAEAKQRLHLVLSMAPGDIDATKALYVALDHAPDDP